MKMKQFSCGAVVPQCHAVFRAKDDDEILTRVAEHARDDHGIEVVSPELVSAVRQNIVTLAD
jgi:predicted small metal-binding protein